MKIENKLEELKNKKVIFAHWRAESKEDGLYHNFYMPLKTIFNNIKTFDPAKEYFNFGRKKMNNNLINFVKKEQPDYLIMGLIYDEIELKTFKKIREVSPKTLIINIYSDDDWRYDDYSRFYTAFFDYVIITQETIDKYLKDGLIKKENIGKVIGVNVNNFKHDKEEKKYDVTFFGRANPNRAKELKKLIDKGINVTIFGDGWTKFTELKNSYKGHLETEKLNQAICESKINLCYTLGGHNKPQLKGRVFEIAAAKAFCLCEYYEGYTKFFKENKELVMYKDEKELLKKIEYYLAHDKEREEIAKNAFLRVNKDHDINKKYLEFFTKLEKNEKTKKDNKLKNSAIFNIRKEEKEKLAILSKEDLKKNKEEIISLTKNKDYIIINDENILIKNRNKNNKEEELKNKIQFFSLKKSNKEVSCCDYYINKKGLGEYLLFKAQATIKKISKENFNKFIVKEQLMFKREFFIKNIDNIKEFLRNKKPILTEENTTFISLPLVSIDHKHLNKILKEESLTNNFQMKYLDILHSLVHQKSIKTIPYTINLLITGIKQRFILKTLYSTIIDKDKINKVLKGYR